VAAELDGGGRRSGAQPRARCAPSSRSPTARSPRARARASAYAFEGAGLYDLRIAAPLRWQLTERLALVSATITC
jgi:hypothetical protein